MRNSRSLLEHLPHLLFLPPRLLLFVSMHGTLCGEGGRKNNKIIVRIPKLEDSPVDSEPYSGDNQGMNDAFNDAPGCLIENRCG